MKYQSYQTHIENLSKYEDEFYSTIDFIVENLLETVHLIENNDLEINMQLVEELKLTSKQLLSDAHGLIYDGCMHEEMD